MPWPSKSTAIVSLDRVSVTGSTVRSTVARIGPSIPVDAPGFRWVDVRDRGGGGPVLPADAAGGQAASTDLWGSGVVHMPVDDPVLALVEPGRVSGVIVDIRC